METIRDITIGWEIGEKYASVDTPPCRIKTRLQKLHEQHPDEFPVYIENDDGSLYAKVPAKWVKINPPKKVSEEQRQAMRERSIKMWEGAKARNV